MMKIKLNPPFYSMFLLIIFVLSAGVIIFFPLPSTKTMETVEKETIETENTVVSRAAIAGPRKISPVEQLDRPLKLSHAPRRIPARLELFDSLPIDVEESTEEVTLFFEISSTKHFRKRSVQVLVVPLERFDWNVEEFLRTGGRNSCEIYRHTHEYVSIGDEVAVKTRLIVGQSYGLFVQLSDKTQRSKLIPFSITERTNEKTLGAVTLGEAPSIKGEVVDSENRPISGAQVILLADESYIRIAERISYICSKKTKVETEFNYRHDIKFKRSFNFTPGISVQIPGMTSKEVGPVPQELTNAFPFIPVITGAVTDAEGHFELQGVISRSKASKLLVLKKGFCGHVCEVSSSRIKLKKSSRVTVKVIDFSGKPVSDGLLYFSSRSLAPGEITLRWDINNPDHHFANYVLGSHSLNRRSDFIGFEVSAISLDSKGCVSLENVLPETLYCYAITHDAGVGSIVINLKDRQLPKTIKLSELGDLVVDSDYSSSLTSAGSINGVHQRYPFLRIEINGAMTAQGLPAGPLSIVQKIGKQQFKSMVNISDRTQAVVKLR